MSSMRLLIDNIVTNTDFFFSHSTQIPANATSKVFVSRK